MARRTAQQTDATVPCELVIRLPCWRHAVNRRTIDQASLWAIPAALTLSAVGSAAHAQTVELRQLRTTERAPIAIVEVTNQTPGTMKYILVECVLFGPNDVA